MIHRRGVLPALVLLILVVVGAVLAVTGGPAGSTTGARPAATTGPDAAGERAVLGALAAIERAYAAGDVRRLCRPGALLDPAVIRAQNQQAEDCESELESLMANVPRLHVTIRALALRPDLASADLVTTFGADASVDFVRRGQHWLMSFSGGADPIPVLAGTT
jgi:hypothetical protein